MAPASGIAALSVRISAARRSAALNAAPNAATASSAVVTLAGRPAHRVPVRPEPVPPPRGRLMAPPAPASCPAEAPVPVLPPNWSACSAAALPVAPPSLPRVIISPAPPPAI